MDFIILVCFVIGATHFRHQAEDAGAEHRFTNSVLSNLLIAGAAIKAIQIAFAG